MPEHGERKQAILKDPHLFYSDYQPKPQDQILSRSEYIDRLAGFWLGQSIANWTGLSTELSRIQAPFHTDEDWGGAADPGFWGSYPQHTSRIDFFLLNTPRVWGADDDTDIEYMYQHLLDLHNTSILTGEQIRDGWLRHIYSNDDAPLSPTEFQRENYLWVSSEQAYTLMLEKGMVPPETSEPVNNNFYEMIDAQLTTELFGLLAPGRPDVALRMAHLPIRTTAKNEAEWIAEFYVIMHALAATSNTARSRRDQLFTVAGRAREHLSEDSYPARMYDFVKAHYEANPDRNNWEFTRDAVYERYQLQETDGYVYKQPFDAGINFAASLVSLFYGEGDLLRTIRIGTLAGWDSDNPTATWGGLLGFMLGKEGVEQAFGADDLSEAYWIHRTRRNFPDHTPDDLGEDTFSDMARRAILIIDRVVQEEMHGGVDLQKDIWYIPAN